MTQCHFCLWYIQGICKTPVIITFITIKSYLPICCVITKYVLELLYGHTNLKKLHFCIISKIFRFHCTLYSSKLFFFMLLQMIHSFNSMRPRCIYALATYITIGSDNGLSPIWCQAIIWTNVRVLSIGPMGTNFSEISIKIQTFSFKKMHFKMSSAKCQPSCLSLNVSMKSGSNRMIREIFSVKFTQLSIITIADWLW